MKVTVKRKIEQEAIRYESDNKLEIAELIAKMEGVDHLDNWPLHSPDTKLNINIYFCDGSDENWNIPLNYWVTEDLEIL